MRALHRLNFLAYSDNDVQVVPVAVAFDATRLA